MIQRIQSVYLLLSCVLMIAASACDCLIFTNVDNDVTYTICCYQLLDVTRDMPIRLPWGMLTCGLISIVLTIISIFSFVKLRKQMRTIAWTIVFILLYIVASVVYPMSYNVDLQQNFQFTFAFFFPVIALICAIMAYKAVKNDDNLIKAADRIR